MAAKILQFLLSWGPLWFGLGFLAPLIAQSMSAASIEAPFGLSTTAFGLMIGSFAGVVAIRRGSWI